jgi:hypothetical protein
MECPLKLVLVGTDFIMKLWVLGRTSAAKAESQFVAFTARLKPRPFKTKA